MLILLKFSSHSFKVKASEALRIIASHTIGELLFFIFRFIWVPFKSAFYGELIGT